MTKDGDGVEEHRTGDAPTPARPAPPRRDRCVWCRRVLPEQRTGRPRQYCSQACRQWHWVGRQRAAELRLSEDELIVATAELDSLHDELYVLACAVDDAERDLAAAGTPTLREMRELVDWLLEAARPLRDRELRRSSSAD
ncbi:MAG: hypothetical protein ACO3C1_06985 [Ilumatobacteraceae bacterium]